MSPNTLRRWIGESDVPAFGEVVAQKPSCVFDVRAGGPEVAGGLLSRRRSFIRALSGGRCLLLLGTGSSALASALPGHSRRTAVERGAERPEPEPRPYGVTGSSSPGASDGTLLVKQTAGWPKARAACEWSRS